MCALGYDHGTSRSCISRWWDLWHCGR